MYLFRINWILIIYCANRINFQYFIQSLYALGHLKRYIYIIAHTEEKFRTNGWSFMIRLTRGLTCWVAKFTQKSLTNATTFLRFKIRFWPAIKLNHFFHVHLCNRYVQVWEQRKKCRQRLADKKNLSAATFIKKQIFCKGNSVIIWGSYFPKPVYSFIN